MNDAFAALRKKSELRVYVRSLMLWYAFMREAERSSGEWTKEGAAVRPQPGESLREWLDRQWDDLEPQPVYAVQVRTAPDQFDWDDAVREVHVTINLEFFTRQFLLDEVAKVIDTRLSETMKNPPGGRKFVNQKAVYQPNVEFTPELLRAYHATLQVLKSRRETLQQKGAEAWPEIDPENQKANARDALKRAEQVLAAVRMGRFPYADRPAFARWLE